MTPQLTDWLRLLKSWSQELCSTIDRIDYLIGNEHLPTKGSYREILLRRLLRRVLPDRYRVSTGFVYRWGQPPSRQIDVLVWDAHNHSALLEEGELVVLTADAVAAMIEVKSLLTPAELRDALDLLNPDWLTYWPHTTATSTSGLKQQVPDVPYRAIFAYNAPQATPDSAALTVFHELASYYAVRFKGDAQLAMTRTGADLNWTNLLDSICIAKGPSIEQVHLMIDCIDGSTYTTPGYISRVDQDLSVGRFCMHIMASLAGWEAGEAARITLRSSSAVGMPGVCCFARPPKEVKRVRAWGTDVAPEGLRIADPPLWELPLSTKESAPS